MVYLDEDDMRRFGITAVGPRNRMLHSCREYEEARVNRVHKTQTRAKEAFAKAELEKLAASNLAMGKFQKERARKAAQERQQKAR